MYYKVGPAPPFFYYYLEVGVFHGNIVLENMFCLFQCIFETWLKVHGIRSCLKFRARKCEGVVRENQDFCHFERWPAENCPRLSRREFISCLAYYPFWNDSCTIRGGPLWRQKWKGSAIRTKTETSLGVCCAWRILPSTYSGRHPTTDRIRFFERIHYSNKFN